MYKRLTLVLFSILIVANGIFAQEIKSVLAAPEGWRKEIIPFPLGFAPSIDFVGFEDIRFSPGWSDAGSDQFWTYHFTWFIDKGENMTEKKLSTTFNAYFDGLMKAVLQGQSDTTNLKQLQKTICLFIKTDKGFQGKVRVFDAFFSKEYVILNFKVEELFCEE